MKPSFAFDPEELAFDALVADIRRTLIPETRCKRTLSYAVARNVPTLRDPPTTTPSEWDFVTAQCERTRGHDGHCIARREDGQMMRGRGAGGRWD